MPCLTGPRLLPAPSRGPPVPVVLRRNSDIQGQRTALSFLHQRMRLLREGHRAFPGSKEVCDHPFYLCANGGGGTREFCIRGRGVKIFFIQDCCERIFSNNFCFYWNDSTYKPFIYAQIFRHTVIILAQHQVPHISRFNNAFRVKGTVWMTKIQGQDICQTTLFKPFPKFYKMLLICYHPACFKKHKKVVFFPNRFF